MYRAVLIKPYSTAEVINVDILEENILKVETKSGSELNNRKLSINNAEIEFTELENNIYAVNLNTRGTYETSGITYSPYSTYPISSNIKLNGKMIYDDVLVVGAYKTADEDFKFYSLSLEETDKYINQINNKIGIFA